MSTLFTNGTVVTASDTYRADVLVKGEQIAAVGRDLPRDGARIVDAAGRYLLPGGVDNHTHLDMPFGGTTSADDFYTGHVAAAFGGTTTHIDFVIQAKGGSLRDALDTWHAKARGKAVIDYGFHLAITDLTPAVMNGRHPAIGACRKRRRHRHLDQRGCRGGQLVAHVSCAHPAAGTRS